MRSRRTLLAAALVLAIIAFLWLTFSPPRWWLNATKQVDLTNPVATGERLVVQYDCRRCHRIDGRGALLAGNLSGVTLHLDSAEITSLLVNPGAARPGTSKQNRHLSDSEITAIIAYLEAVDSQ
jgi:mono/diheme cytochrome c family protein